MGRAEPPDTGRDPSGVPPAPGRDDEHRRIGGWSPALLEVLWSCALVAVPLGFGLAANATLGWWPGLGAFLVAAVITGVAAHRTDPRRQRR
jgi:hypothetical protein